MRDIILIFCVLSAVPSYFAICRKQNPERITLMTLFCNVLLFYLACMFHQINKGLILILAANFAFFIPTVRQLFREPAAWKRFFTPAMTAYFMMLPVLYAATYYLKFSQWDEFSHWGSAAKLLFCSGRLNCELDRYLGHASYPPGQPLIDIFLHKCVSPNFFRENITFFANSLTISTILLGFVSEKKERGNVLIRLGGMLAGCTVMFWLLSDWLCSLYTEPLLITLGALVLFRVFTSEENIFDDLELMIYMMMMILIKASAMGIIVFAMTFYLIRVWRHRECRKTKWEKCLPVLVCLMPLLVKSSWSLMLKYFNTFIVFSPEVPWLKAIWQLLTGRHDYAGKVTWSMCRQFFSTPVLYLSLFALIAGAVFYCLKGKNKPAEWKMLYFVFMPLFFLVMMFSLLMTYLFVFNRFQADLLVSFERYTITFLGILLLIQLYLLLKEKFLQNTCNIWFRPLAVICLMCLMISLSERFSQGSIKWRDKADHAQKAYASIIRPGEKFTVLTRKGSGMKNYIYQYIFPDNFTRIQWFDPVLPDKDAELYQVQLSPEELLKKLQGTVDYVLIESMDEEFYNDYKSIFAENESICLDQAMYRVTPEGLKYISEPPAQ